MALAIFALTYFFLAGFRLRWTKLDRPGGALVGAAAMVAFGVVAPKDALAAIDFDTLILLLGMMLLAAYLTRAGFFRNAAWRVLKVARTPRVLLVCLAVVSAVLSAFLVNDTVCLMLTPLVLVLVEGAELPPLPYLLTLCMASNTGSLATFTGNPQNMLIGNLSGQSYGTFAAYMALPAAVATAVVVVTILVMFRAQLPAKRFVPAAAVPPIDSRLLWLCGAVSVAVVGCFFAGLSMAWSALVGAAAVVALSGKPPREQLEKIDWVLLLFFASLFVVVHGVSADGWAERMRQAFAPLMQGSGLKETAGFSALTLVGSNLFSNVPFVMLARSWVPAMSNPALGWQVLALASTLAGNLTLVG
ncbi:MAG: Arsenical pump rane protein, partial [Myxococcaceae bacterium]|nr:Arsenical pump rane protein [Myxococcaceae bacterium]